jgi:DNA-binding GntR family transcriptional regulator
MSSRETNGVPVADTVAALIRSAILEGEFAPGQRLREDQLAAKLGVSRTPIREALRILSAEGYLESTRYAGSRVRAYDADEVNAAFEARALLEGLAARRAASRAQPTQIRRMHESCQRYAALGPVTPDNVAAVIDENNLFHEIVFEAAGSDVIAETVRKLSDLPLSQRVGVGLASGEQKRIAEYSHRQLTKAIGAGDADWADAIGRAHVLDQRDRTMPFLTGLMLHKPHSESSKLPTAAPSPPEAPLGVAEAVDAGGTRAPRKSTRPRRR